MRVNLLRHRLLLIPNQHVDLFVRPNCARCQAKRPHSPKRSLPQRGKQRIHAPEGEHPTWPSQAQSNWFSGKAKGLGTLSKRPSPFSKRILIQRLFLAFPSLSHFCPISLNRFSHLSRVANLMKSNFHIVSIDTPDTTSKRKLTRFSIPNPVHCYFFKEFAICKRPFGITVSCLAKRLANDFAIICVKPYDSVRLPVPSSRMNRYRSVFNGPLER